MKNVEKKITLKGQLYATPRTESVEISNHGVLCASGGSSNGLIIIRDE